MKNIKTFENYTIYPKYKKNDYVFVNSEYLNINVAGIIVDEIDKDTYIVKDLNNDDVDGEIHASELRSLTDLELSSIKYNI